MERYPMRRCEHLVQVLLFPDGRPMTECRPSDGYMNATRLCRSTGKHWKNFARQRMTKEYLEYLEPTIQRNPIQPDEYGIDDVWVDYNVGMRLAGWCRVDFQVAATIAVMDCMLQDASLHDARRPDDDYQATQYAMEHDPAYTVNVPQLIGRYLRREISLRSSAIMSLQTSSAL